MNEDILDAETIEGENLNYAGFGTRVLSYFIDIIPIIILLSLILYLGFGMSPFGSGKIGSIDEGLLINDAKTNKLIVRYLALIVWIVYSIFMDASSSQGTFGKKAVQLKVVNERGEKISQGQSILRNSMKLLSYIPLGLGFFWPVFDKKKRTWHDMIAKTYVVKSE